MADNDYMSTQEVLTGIKTWVKKEIGTNIYDISANHNGAKYANLSAALGTNGANIPQSLRKGGMSVKFVQSSDNKYVQYRLMDDEWSTTESDWQGVDDEPTAGSDNLVKSGGIYKVMNLLSAKANNENIIDKNYVRVGKGFNDSSSKFIINTQNSVISCYYKIPNDAIKCVVSGVSGYSSTIYTRFTENVDDTEVGYVIKTTSALWEIELDTIRNSYPNINYVCFYVFRGDLSNIDLSNVNIYFSTFPVSCFRDIPTTIKHKKILGVIKSDGTIDTSSTTTTYRVSEPIPVVAGETYTIGISGSNTTIGVGMFSTIDASSIILDKCILNDGTARLVDVVIPEGITYIRTTTRTTLNGDTNIYKQGKYFKDIDSLFNISKTNGMMLSSESNAFNSEFIREGKGIHNGTGKVTDYTSGTGIITGYYLIPEDCNKIYYSGLVEGAGIRARMCDAPRDDAANAFKIDISSSGSIDLSSLATRYKYICFWVYRSAVVGENPDLSSVSIKFVNEDESATDISFSSIVVKNKNIAPEKGCVCFEMDFNPNNAPEFYDDFVNTLRSYGVNRFTTMLEPQNLTSYKSLLSYYYKKGYEIGLHSRAADGIGELNPYTHPTPLECKTIIAGYYNTFMNINGVMPFGWVTSQGKIVTDLLPVVKEYFGYAHTDYNYDVEGSDYANYINNKQRSRYQLYRLNIENDLNTGETEEDAIIANANAAIDLCVANKGFIVFSLHSYKKASANYTLRERVLKAILAHLKTYIDACEVVTGNCLDLVNYYYPFEQS